eukprot:g4899.t1
MEVERGDGHGANGCILPGDDVTERIRSALDIPEGDDIEGRVELDESIKLVDERPLKIAIAVMPGQFRVEKVRDVSGDKKAGRAWIETNARRYTPKRGDVVIGTICARMGLAGYKVEIHARCPAMLPALAFDGATKRNHPNLPVGTLIHARVNVDDPHTEPQLTCCAEEGQQKKDWMSGEAIYGRLEGGVSIRCGAVLSRAMLQPQCAVLDALAASLQFELAVGANGVAWVCAESRKDTIIIVNAIKNSAYIDNNAVERMVELLLLENS